MASYTIEDIEFIRKKSGVSYQEAVALLDYHNGNVTRALIDLERNGRIHSDEPMHAQQPQQTKQRKEKGGLAGLIQKLYRTRVHVTKDRTSVANLSVLFLGGCFLAAPWIVIVSAVLSAVLGYKISYVKDDPDFASANLEETVRNARDNARTTVDDMVRNARSSAAAADLGKTVRNTAEDLVNTIKDAAKDLEQHTQAQAPAADPETTTTPDSSYYTANPAATTYHGGYKADYRDIPTIQVPVQVESTDGNVSIESEDDGHNSATIG